MKRISIIGYVCCGIINVLGVVFFFIGAAIKNYSLWLSGVILFTISIVIAILILFVSLTVKEKAKKKAIPAKVADRQNSPYSRRKEEDL